MRPDAVGLVAAALAAVAAVAAPAFLSYYHQRILYNPVNILPVAAGLQAVPAAAAATAAAAVAAAATAA